MLDTLKGELRIFTKEVELKSGKNKVLFNTCIGFSKDSNDKYTNYYILVNFASDLKKEVAKVYKQDSFDILLKEGWIKAYKDKEGHVNPVLFVNDATIVSSDTKKKTAKKTAKKEDKELEPIEDEDLPF